MFADPPLDRRAVVRAPCSRHHGGLTHDVAGDAAHECIGRRGDEGVIGVEFGGDDDICGPISRHGESGARGCGSAADWRWIRTEKYRSCDPERFCGQLSVGLGDVVYFVWYNNARSAKEGKNVM